MKDNKADVVEHRSSPDQPCMNIISSMRYTCSHERQEPTNVSNHQELDCLFKILIIVSLNNKDSNKALHYFVRGIHRVSKSWPYHALLTYWGNGCASWIMNQIGSAKHNHENIFWKFPFSDIAAAVKFKLYLSINFYLQYIFGKYKVISTQYYYTTACSNHVYLLDKTFSDMDIRPLTSCVHNVFLHNLCYRTKILLTWQISPEASVIFVYAGNKCNTPRSGDPQGRTL